MLEVDIRATDIMQAAASAKTPDPMALAFARAYKVTPRKVRINGATHAVEINGAKVGHLPDDMIAWTRNAFLEGGRGAGFYSAMKPQKFRFEEGLRHPSLRATEKKVEARKNSNSDSDPFADFLGEDMEAFI
jgi:hypothetical protein